MAKKKAKKTAKKSAKKTTKKVAKKVTKKKIVAKKAVAKKSKIVKKTDKAKAPHRKATLKRLPATKRTVSKRSTVASAIPPKPRKAPSDAVVNAVIKGIQELKGQNLVCLDLRKVENSVCEYFVICEAQSRTQVDAIANSVTEEVKEKTNARPFHSEGYQNAEWILIDYITTVVHIFQPQIRAFYNLEGLWADAEKMEVGEN